MGQRKLGGDGSPHLLMAIDVEMLLGVMTCGCRQGRKDRDAQLMGRNTVLKGAALLGDPVLCIYPLNCSDIYFSSVRFYAAYFPNIYHNFSELQFETR